MSLTASFAASPVCSAQRSLAIVDPVRPHHVLRALEGFGWTTSWCTSLDELMNRRSSTEALPFLLVELRPRETSILDSIQRVAAETPTVVWSAFGGIQVPRIIRKLGALAFLPKPASGQQVLAAFGEGAVQSTMPLEEARMLYIEEVLARSGSVSRAAKHLGVDRRSFRRMLDRFAESAPEGSAIAAWAHKRGLAKCGVLPGCKVESA